MHCFLLNIFTAYYIFIKFDFFAQLCNNSLFVKKRRLPDKDFKVINVHLFQTAIVDSICRKQTSDYALDESRFLSWKARYKPLVKFTNELRIILSFRLSYLKYQWYRNINILYICHIYVAIMHTYVYLSINHSFIIVLIQSNRIKIV